MKHVQEKRSWSNKIVEWDQTANHTNICQKYLSVQSSLNRGEKYSQRILCEYWPHRLVLGVVLCLQLLNHVHHVLHVLLDTGMQGPVTGELHFVAGTTWTVLPVSGLIKFGFSQESGAPENENRWIFYTGNTECTPWVRSSSWAAGRLPVHQLQLSSHHLEIMISLKKILSKHLIIDSTWL